MRKFSIRISKGHLRINGFVQRIGQDILVSIWGGTKPHIGAIGMAIPRPSLKNSKRWSATSSIFTFVGHKEDMIVKRMSEKLAAQLGRNVVVAAGLHWDETTSREIRTIQTLTQRLSDQILKRMEKIK